jgi:hypothetical protein
LQNHELMRAEIFIDWYYPLKVLQVVQILQIVKNCYKVPLRFLGIFKLWVFQWLRILDYIFSAYCAHRAILIKMAIFETFLLMNSYEI